MNEIFYNDYEKTSSKYKYNNDKSGPLTQTHENQGVIFHNQLAKKRVDTTPDDVSGVFFDEEYDSHKIFELREI